MANSYPTAADLLQLGDGNISDIEVSELLEDTPLLAVVSAVEASNETSHEWIKKTVAPTAGARSVNDGVENSTATYTKVTQALTVFDSSFSIDLALLKLKSGDALKRREAIDHLKASMVSMEKQLIYGDGADSDGFLGFANEASVDKKDDAMVIDATGTTANGTTSVWAIRAGETAVSAVFGGSARIELGEEYMTTIAGSTTGVFDALRTPVVFWGGCQVATTLDLARICNLTKQSGKTLDDDMLSDLVHLFPSGRGPTHLVMSKQSRKQLQQSRTATNATGAPAPRPTDYEGIPIIVTDSIVDTEAVVAATA